MEEMRRHISVLKPKFVSNSEIQRVVLSSLFTSLLEYMFRCMCLRVVGGREIPQVQRYRHVFERGEVVCK